NTRINILQQIISWARDFNHPSLSSLFWLFGLAGTGKSTIAQSVCEILKMEGLLASSYFCSIQLDSKDSKRIVPTIVYHLASFFPIFGKHLASTLRADPGCASARIYDQFRDLLCAPWSLFSAEAAPQRSCVVVIDALDECDDREAVLGLILAAIDNDQLQGIRFLATSRPVPTLVKKALELNRGPQIALQEVSKEEVSGDIRLFLEEQLHEMVEPATIRELTTRVDGLFIFASTLVKHLVPTFEYTTLQDIKERLRQILNPDQGEGVRDVGLDGLYDHILRTSLLSDKFGAEGFKQRLLILQTVVSMEQATTPSVISDFLGYDVEDVIGIVNSLHSVLFTRGPGDPICVIHASFRDFVVSHAREPFLCDPSSIHNLLAQSCLSRMQESLKFNICNIESSFTTNDSLSLPLHYIGESLAYACLHWWAHLQRCTERVIFGSDSKIVKIWDAAYGNWVRKLNGHGSSVTSVAFSPDGKRIVSGSSDKTVRIWDVDSGKQLRKLNGHDSLVTSVAFSPDGKRVVSGSDDNTVQSWDADAAKQPCWLDGHESSITSVAFSPDGKRVVSGSSDKTVRIWDADSGKQLQKLDGHGDWVRSVAFSPDGNCVGSGSSDKTVRIWDVDSGKQLRKLHGHRDSVRSVAFSPDCKRIVSVSDDQT
ncbi:WD40-repeat-containing domain protein, partial [Flagelloscypha sp. PMI_526]